MGKVVIDFDEKTDKASFEIDLDNAEQMFVSILGLMGWASKTTNLSIDEIIAITRDTANSKEFKDASKGA